MANILDIELLDPLYREVFRDPANGTPDKISAEGCLALSKLGSKSWNAWRKLFPANKDNNAKFQKINGFEYANFQNFNFGEHANFKGAIFKNADTSFEGAIFGGGVRFSAAMFLQGVSFKGAIFQGDVSFFGTHFGRGLNFTGAIFNGKVDFRAAEWAQIRVYYEFISGNKIGLVAAKEYASEFFTSPASFPDAKFEAAQFGDSVDFNGRKFLSATSFKDTQFSGSLNFHNCDVNSDTNFHNTSFAKPTGSFEKIVTYNVLKLTFSKQLNVREEQRFFKLEMAEENVQAVGMQRHLCNFYSLCSDYGFSISRPMFLWIGTLVSMMLIYGGLSYLNNCLPDPARCSFSTAWIEFSLIQALPLPGLDKLSESLRGKLFPVDGLISIGVTFFVILHKVITLLALFLMGLALRNLFKLK